MIFFLTALLNLTLTRSGVLNKKTIKRHRVVLPYMTEHSVTAAQTEQTQIIQLNMKPTKSSPASSDHKYRLLTV